MKRIIIVHGWGGNPQQNWMPLVKKDLEKRGWEVRIPAMPDTKLPKLNRWLSKLDEVIGDPDKNLYLVGHSLGCITIMRYLEKLPGNQKIGGVIFLAGFTDGLNIQEVKTFFETPINFADIKQKADKFVALHSDNDEYVSLRYGDIFKEKLGAEVIIKHLRDHFSDPKDDKENSILLQEIIESINL